MTTDLLVILNCFIIFSKLIAVPETALNYMPGYYFSCVVKVSTNVEILFLLSFHLTNDLILIKMYKIHEI